MDGRFGLPFGRERWWIFGGGAWIVCRQRMENFLNIISQPFVWGLGIGLALFVLCFYHLLKTKREFHRYKRMLSDKMELEAEQASKLKGELDGLRIENENMRLKLAQMSEKPDVKLERELEIMARAERAMNVSAPGFAPAWETAKTAAAAELAEEANGKSLPKRLFRKFFGGGEVTDVEALPAPQEGEEVASSS